MKKLAKILDLSSITTGWRYSSTGRTHYRRFICIGDIHGCYDQLIDLLEKCKYNKKTDIIISCGDLCDRGYNNVDVLKFFIEAPNVYSVLGNHDDKLRRHLLGNKVKIGKSLQTSLDEISIKCDLIYKEKISNYLNNLPHIIRLPDFNNKPLYVVHAGFDAKYTPDKQTPETCIYIRGIDPKNYFDESKGIWFDFLDGTYTVLSGHIVSKTVQPNPSVFCLDGGACHGGVLRALVINNSLNNFQGNRCEIIEVEGYKKDMKIPEEFRIIEGNNGEKLITPEFGVGNEAWHDFNLRFMRSLHIDKDDKVISCGFPKFVNAGEGYGKFNVTEKDLLDKKDLIATLKIDGSCLIRFVHNGIVRWRTRGSLTVGLDNKDEIEGFINRYPKLNDPTLYSNMSLLFEWVSPRNQIVIKYETPEIYLIGAILFERNTKWVDNEFSLFTMKELTKISETLSSFDDHLMPCVKHFNLKNKIEIIDLIEKLKTEKEIEGWVLRFNNEQELVKIKSDHYFILHALKSKLDSCAIVDLFLSWERPSFEEFKSKFIAAYDYEIWTTILPAVSSICNASQIADNVYNHIVNLVEENKKLSRKDFALLMKQKYSGEKLALCFSLLDNKPIKSNFFKTIILQNIKNYDFSIFKKEKINDDQEE